MQSLVTKDPLFTLMLLCDVLKVEANDHTTCYNTVGQHLTKLIKGGLEMDDDTFKRLSNGNTLFEIDFWPQRAEGGCSLVGDDFEALLDQAIAIARPWALDPDELAAIDEDGDHMSGDEENNSTTNFLRMVAGSKCAVGCSLNAHRLDSIGEPGKPMRPQTVLDALQWKIDNGDDEVEDALENGEYVAMIEEDVMVEAYAYTSTPVGSYDIFHLNWQPCLRQMRQIVESANIDPLIQGLNLHTDKVAAELRQQGVENMSELWTHAENKDGAI